MGSSSQFKKKKAPPTYRYDSSLSPALDWDGQHPARETGEALIKEIAECGLRSAELSKQPATVWDHLAGTVSAPFAAGEHGQIAVKVIDQRGNELLVVKSLKEAKQCCPRRRLTV